MDLEYWSYKNLPNIRAYQKLNMRYFTFKIISTEFAETGE